MRTCTFNGCVTEKLHAYGMCSKHYTTSDRFRELNRKNQERYRKEQRQWYKDSVYRMVNRPQFRKIQNIDSITRYAIRNGMLVRQSCEQCGKKAEPHHDSYLPGDELKVRWLCRSHHKLWHVDNVPVFPENLS